MPSHTDRWLTEADDDSVTADSADELFSQFDELAAELLSI